MVQLSIHAVAPRRAAYFACELLAAATVAALVLAVLAPRSAPLPGALLVGAILLGALSLADLHDLRGALADARAGSGRLLRLLGALVATAGVVLIVTGVSSARWAPVLTLGLPAAASMTLLGRAALPLAEARLGLLTRIFLVGEGRAAQQLLREIERDGAVEVVGRCASRSEVIGVRARAAGARLVVVATDDRRGLAMGELLRCRLDGIEVIEAAPFAARALHRLPVELIHPGDLVFGEGFRTGPLRRASRRALSVVVAILLLVAAAPLLLLSAVAIRADSRGPVLFRQERVGRAGRVFRMLKLRTMREGAERGGAVWARRDDPRVTRVGRVLRRFRVDELPQLVNVLRGDMELVGPRPERPQFVADLRRRIPFYDLRHLVAPGITGWAQVRYPYAASVEETREKLQYDLYFVRHQGVLLDLFVLLLTARTVLLGRGAR